MERLYSYLEKAPGNLEMKCLPPGGIHLRCAGHQARPWEFHDEQPLSLCAFLTGESYVAGNLVKSYEIAIVISAQIPDKVTSFGWKEGGCTGMVGWGQTEINHCITPGVTLKRQS